MSGWWLSLLFLLDKSVGLQEAVSCEYCVLQEAARSRPVADNEVAANMLRTSVGGGSSGGDV